MAETSTDCRSPDGVTVGLIDAIISISRVLKGHDLSTPAAREALLDLMEDDDFFRICTSAPISSDFDVASIFRRPTQNKEDLSMSSEPHASHRLPKDKHSDSATITAEIVNLRDRIANLEHSVAWLTGHAEQLDKNWSAVHDAAGNAVRDAAGLDRDCSIPEVCQAIKGFRDGIAVQQAALSVIAEHMSIPRDSSPSDILFAFGRFISVSRMKGQS
jgi:hypothetical protein